MAEKKAEIKIGYDGKQAEKGLKGLKNSVANTAKDIKRSIGVASAAFIALSASIGYAVKTFGEQEFAEARLESIAKKVTKATDDEIKSLKNLAATYQDLSSFGDEVIITGQSQLLSFGLTAKEAEKLTGSLVDVIASNNRVAASSQDAIQAANILGKAFAGQAGSLSRVGILLNDVQTKILQTGTASEKTAALVEIVNQNYGGLAKTLSTTFFGSIQQAKNSFSDLTEAIGQPFVFDIKVFSVAVKEISKQLSKNSDFQNAIIEIKNNLKNLFMFIIDNKEIILALGTSFLVLGTAIGRSTIQIALLAKGFVFAKKAFVDFENTKKITKAALTGAADLLGLKIYADELERNKKNLTETTQKIKDLENNIKSLQGRLSSNYTNFDDFIKADENVKKIKELREEIKRLSSVQKVQIETQQKTKAEYDKISNEYDKQKEKLKVFRSVAASEINGIKSTVESLKNSYEKLNSVDFGQIIDNSKEIVRTNELKNKKIEDENNLLEKNIELREKNSFGSSDGLPPLPDELTSTDSNFLKSIELQIEASERKKELLQSDKDFEISLMNETAAAEAAIQEGRIEAFDGWIEHQKQAEQEMLNFKFGVFQSAGSAFAKMLTGNSKDLKKYFLFFVADTIRSYANMKAQQELATASNATNIATQESGWAAFYSALAVGMSAYDLVGAGKLTTSAGLLTGAAGLNTAVAASSLAKAAAWSIGGQVAAAGIESLAGSTSSGDTSLATDGITTTAEDTPLTTSTQSGSNVTLVFRDNIFGDDKEAFYEFARDKIAPNLKELADLSNGGLQLG